MQIAIIGAGNVGGALGRAWARTGHRIRYGVGSPADKKHQAIAAAAGNATISVVAEAVWQADAIVLAVPWDAVPSAVAAAGDLRGRVLIDVTNPLRMGSDGLELALGFDRSGGERVAELAPGALVFKTMNQVGSTVMADARGYPTPPAMFVAGDDEVHKPVVMGLVAELGFAPIDTGPLRIARLLEPYAMLWIHQAINRGSPQNSAFAFMQGKSAPTSGR